ncbi:MAG: FecR domain-containing protein [Pseudomonadota bacterium]
MTNDATNIREEVHIWRARIGTGPLPAEERMAFDAWLQADDRHSEAFAEAEITWRVTGRADLSATLSAYAETVNLHEAPSASVIQKQTPWLWAAGSVAAAITLTIAVSLHFGLLGDDPSTIGIEESIASYTTGIGEVRDIVLPDNSTMTIGARSEASVHFTAGRRMVSLHTGSVFFDVAHDANRPFVVSSESIDVVATGTAFDVQRRADRLRVGVAEGSVRVSRPLTRSNQRLSSGGMRESVALQAGETVGVRDVGDFEPLRRLPVGLIGAWRSGQLVYLRTSLEDVVEDIQNVSGLSVFIDEDVRDLQLSGTFDADDIDGLLEAVEAALPVLIERQNDDHIIVSHSK